MSASLISAHESDISICKGKDVVVFFGMSGAGKSSLINGILGKHLTRDDKDVISHDSNHNEDHATIGDGKALCTKFPKGYDFEDGKFVLLDTRGFPSSKCSCEDEEFKASLSLLGKALNEAKSVRVVCVAKAEGVVNAETFTAMVNTVIGKLFKTKNEIPILFAANTSINGIKWNEVKGDADKVTESINAARGAVVGGIQAMIGGFKQNFGACVNKLKATHGDGFSQTEEFKNMSESNASIDLFLANLKKGNTVYYEADVPESIKPLKESLSRLEPIPISELAI